MKFKNFFSYLLFLLPWFISSILFKVDKNYYLSLRLPFFAPTPFIFAIVWPILYILIAISIYKIYKDRNNIYTISLIFNYIFNQLYTFFFFVLKNNFLGLIDSIIVLVTSIILFIEIKKIDKNKSYFLIPYILWNIFAFILSISIIILN